MSKRYVYSKETSNTVAKTLFFIGISIIVIGFFGGAIIANQPHDPYSVFDWEIFIFSIFSSFISGMLFIGFSEIIKKLDNIDKRMFNQGKYLDREMMVEKEQKEEE